MVIPVASKSVISAVIGKRAFINVLRWLVERIANGGASPTGESIETVN